jgi:hypothetical protein
MTLRTLSAFEAEGNHSPYRIHAPTPEQYYQMNDRLVHGEVAVSNLYPELTRDYDLNVLAVTHPEIWDVFSFDIAVEGLPIYVPNIINEHLAGPKLSARDLLVLRNRELWYEQDEKYLDQIRVNVDGCWEMPKYIDHIKPMRARYPQPRTYSSEHDDIRQQMGGAWMWDRVVGPLPTDKLPNDRRAFWPDHRCNNKACVYPRHLVLGTSYANDAFTARMDMMSTYEEWTSKQWARASYAYPDGIEGLLSSDEMIVLSDRAVLLPVSMSKKEFEACRKTLAQAHHLPDGGSTTDPGYHVLLGAMRRGLDFDSETGCWNARIDLDTIAPHKRTVTHACGNMQCVNIRHMDIAEDQKKYYMIQASSYVTLPSGEVVNTNTGELLPSYWESWTLYWEWLRAYSETSQSSEDNAQKEYLLSATDFGHVWVHPLTGCWENERFYPRWSSSGAQMNAYGFHRSSFGALGRSMHRYLLYKYMEFIGQKMVPDLSFDADHRCDNRRCCNPLHMQFTDKVAHNEQTRRRQRHEQDDVAVYIAGLSKLRKLGRR